MGRWEPNTRARLMALALELYDERGYDQTTVADIAAAAGLTERTFFRHFADKREVLFSGSDDLRRLMLDAVRDAGPGLAPLDVVSAALDAAVELLGGDVERSRRRQHVIAATPVLQEREVMKMASLAGGLAAALRERGVPDPAATVAAEAGIAVFRTAFERYAGAAESDDLAALMRDSLATLRAVTSG